MLRYETPEPGRPVVLILDGKRLELRFTLGVMRQVEQDHNVSLLKGNGLADILRDPGKLAILLTYGLRTKQPECTLEWVEDNFDSSMLISLGTVLAFCMTGSLPDLEKYFPKSPNGNGPIAPESGSTSGPSAVTTSDLAN
jgi:hypothetical protein